MDIITAENIKIAVMAVGPVQTNCYIVNRFNSKKAFVIDPGDEGEKIERYLEENELEPEAVLLTHGHFDHILGIPYLKEKYRIPVYAGEKEQELLEDDSKNCTNMIGLSYGIKPEYFLKDGRKIDIDEVNIQVLETPGHTAGGVCYYLPEEKLLFAGDTLFCGSIGRTDLPTGNEGRLIDSIKKKLLPLPDDVTVFTGHGEPTTIGYERKHNVFIC